MGFEVVINLAMPHSDNAIPEEGYIVTARKMLYIHLAVPFEAPTAEHLKSFFAIMDAFAAKKCWIHCALNYRASAFIYQYFKLVKNIPSHVAKESLFDGWEPNPVWLKLMALEKADLGL